MTFLNVFFFKVFLRDSYPFLGIPTLSLRILLSESVILLKKGFLSLFKGLLFFFVIAFVQVLLRDSYPSEGVFKAV